MGRQKMMSQVKTHCVGCKRDTPHTVKKVTDSGEEKDLNQFDIQLKTEAGKILEKTLQDQDVALLQCHMCDRKHSVECHITKK